MPDRSETFTIERSLPRERLDKFLAGIYGAVSRGTLQRLIEDGDILVNGARVKPTHSPRAGEVVAVRWPPPKSGTTEPEALPLDILHEDDSLLVLNKAPGTVVHPSAGHDAHTLVNALLHHCRGQLSGIAGVARPGIVHRLDRDTSGCMVVAKTDEAHLALSRQFAVRHVTKLYHAIVCGELVNETGAIEASIARHPSQRKRMAVLDRGREARTGFHLLQRLDCASFVEVQLHTGRTHQIRVHFQHIGHPVLGDAVYGRRHSARVTELTGFKPARQLLHARSLGFKHPRTGREIACTAPWPGDLEDALSALKLR
jgi:23S rRNA pseudouridine1911/1915/1917 synthase